MLDDMMTILMADDDLDDCELTEHALREARVPNPFRYVHDGVELLQYLRHEGRYSDSSSAPRPGLILLDLNMPRLDGRQVLSEIKADPKLRRIPVVVLTTSKAQEDILRSYDLGVNSFITKPVEFDKLIEIMRVLGEYWFEIVRLPEDEVVKRDRP